MGYDDHDWDEPPRFTYPVRLPGHDLRSEGVAHAVPGCRDGRCWTNRVGRTVRTRWFSDGTGGPGHALCSCGATSGHLPSAAQRKAWHRAHKAEVAAASRTEEAK